MCLTDSWRVLGGRAFGSAPFLVAGIVNATPDSFSDGGRYYDAQDAVAHGVALARQGAHMLDIGGESTRPGAAFVSAAEEELRVLPVLEELAALRGQGRLARLAHETASKKTPEADADGACSSLAAPYLSVDTWRASTAARALQAGAEIINDISGGTFDPEMSDVLAQYAPGYVLMHCPAPPSIMQAAPAYTDVVAEVLEFFEKRLAKLVQSGLPEDRIILDPGIGFGKNVYHNLELMRQAPRLLSLGRPLYCGISRKAFLGKLLNRAVDDRDAATQTVTALLARAGVYAHRVHNVAAAVDALCLTRLLQPV